MLSCLYIEIGIAKLLHSMRLARTVLLWMLLARESTRKPNVVILLSQSRPMIKLRAKPHAAGQRRGRIFFTLNLNKNACNYKSLEQFRFQREHDIFITRDISPGTIDLESHTF